MFFCSITLGRFVFQDGWSELSTPVGRFVWWGREELGEDCGNSIQRPTSLLCVLVFVREYVCVFVCMRMYECNKILYNTASATSPPWRINAWTEQWQEATIISETITLYSVDNCWHFFYWIPNIWKYICIVQKLRATTKDTVTFFLLIPG